MKQAFALITRPVIFLSILFVLCTAGQVHAQYLWSNVLNIPGSSLNTAMAVDEQGNTYNAGHFSGTFDADPGPGINNLTAQGALDIYIIKFDNNGNFVWAKNFGGTGQYNFATTIMTDATGNLYVAGSYQGTVDFDPGPGVTSHTADGGNLDIYLSDAYISKFTPAGDFVWVKVFNNSTTDYGQEYIGKISADDAGNIYAVGQYRKPFDLNPGPGTVEVTSTGTDNAFLVKLDQDGNYINGISLMPAGAATSLVVKNSNLYICVQTSMSALHDITKLDLDFNVVWQISEPQNCSPYDMAVDAAGNVILVGTFYSTVDFDPGPGIYNLTALGDQEMFVSKINNDGQFKWARAMGTGSDFDDLNTVAINLLNGDIYLGGETDGPIYFDGSNPDGYLEPIGSDAFIEKLDSNNNFKWVLPVSGSGSARIDNLYVDAAANIIFRGLIIGDNDFNPSPQQANILTGDPSYIGNFNCKWGPYPVARQFYNTKANLGLQNTGTWSSTPDGAGISPQNFTDPGQTFNVTNQAFANLSGILSIWGLNSKLVIGDGTAAINLTIPAGSPYVDPATLVNVLNNATLTIQNNTIPGLNILANGSTIDFAQTGTGSSDTIRIPLQNYYDLKLTNGLKYFSKDTLKPSSGLYVHTIIRHNLVADAVVSMNGTYLPGDYSSQVECRGDISFLNGTAFEPDVTGVPGRYELLLTGAQIQHVNANGTDLFFSTLHATGPGVILSANANMNIGSIQYTEMYVGAGTVFYSSGGNINFIHGGAPEILGAIASDQTSISMLRSIYSDANELRFTPSSTVKDFTVHVTNSSTIFFYLRSNLLVTGTLTLTRGLIFLMGTDTLELTSTSSVIGGSTQSYVAGVLKRTGSFPFTFPVGQWFKYAPIEILNGIGTNTYTVGYIANPYPVRLIDPATLALYSDYSISGLEYWNIQPGSPGASADISFQYTDPTSQIFTPNQLRIAHFDGTDWNDLGGVPDALNTTTSGKVTVAGVSTFSPFTFSATTGFVVPVKLSSFSARKEDKVVKLNWTTEQEINSKEFIIERSSDQNKWNQLLRVNAAGNSSQKINYTATDFNPAKGINYYRLRQVDLDGRFTYSEIRSVYFGNNMNVVLAPNPAKDKLAIYLPGNTALVSVNIYNSNDQLVKTIASAEETIPVNVGNLSKGIYTVKISGKNINEVRKVIVN